MKNCSVRKMICFVIIVVTCSSVYGNEEDTRQDTCNDLRLWYQTPAMQWTDALPVGNGRLGCMVFGDVEKERIQFNEDSLWTGAPHDYSHPDAYTYLPKIRQLLFEGKQREAEKLGLEKFMSIPLGQQAYQPFGDVWIEMQGVEDFSDYMRQLDLDTAVSSVQYKKNGVTYTRSVFASFPDQVIVIHLTSNKPKMLNCTVSMTSPHKYSQVAAKDGMLILKGSVSENPNNSVAFESRLKVYEQNGKLELDDNMLKISNADCITLLLVAATNYKNYNDLSANPAKRCRQILSSFTEPYQVLLEKHVEDHQSLFKRVAIDLGKTDQAKKPTIQRIKESQTKDDPHLVSLLFQYGRYLMIACSRPGSQPANLQGLWNESLTPPWESKYTLNINAEMNYWPVESCNLSECHEPFFDLIEECSITGRNAAKVHYDARGWVVHHNTDIWRGTAPINASNHGIWNTRYNCYRFAKSWFVKAYSIRDTRQALIMSKYC